MFHVKHREHHPDKEGREPMTGSRRPARTRQRVTIVRLLLETTTPLSAEDVCTKGQMSYECAWQNLSRLEDEGWAYAPGQRAQRTRGITRFYMLTALGREEALDYI